MEDMGIGVLIPLPSTVPLVIEEVIIVVTMVEMDVGHIYWTLFI